MLAELLENREYYYRPFSLTKNEFVNKLKKLFPELSIEEFSDSKIILKLDNRPYLNIISLDYIKNIEDFVSWKQFHIENKCENSFVVTYFIIYHLLKFKDV